MKRVSSKQSQFCYLADTRELCDDTVAYHAMTLMSRGPFSKNIPKLVISDISVRWLGHG